MKFLIVVLALILSLVQGKKVKAIFGKSLTQNAERKLQRQRMTRRNAVAKPTTAVVPEKRRLGDVSKNRRNLPYYGMFVL
jgi:hypothetical protein